MFQSLKQKIAKETGQDVTKLTFNNSKSARNSISQSSSQENDETEAEVNVLRNELIVARNKIKTLEEEKIALEESLKICQVQKDMVLEDTDKIQNIQHQEIGKLKNHLLFKEQESLDMYSKTKIYENQIENYKSELSRIKSLEPMYEDAKDELENLRRSSQMEKNQLTSKLSAQEEEIRHLTAKLEIIEQRACLNSSDSESEKIKLLLQERKMLESRLEEAHIHLYEIKSNWTTHNLTLENQLQRLSRQVAEETAEKRKIVEEKESLVQRVKQLESETFKFKEELKARDNKIKLMSEEIDELNSSLRELHLENEEEIEFLRSKVAYQESELNQSKESLLKACENATEYEEQILTLQKEIIELREKNKNAESRIMELSENLVRLESENLVIADLQTKLDKSEAEVADKNKAIKILNQRLFDVKKTLQEEIKNKESGSTGSLSSNGPAILIPMNIDNNSNHQSLAFNLKKSTSNISGPIVLDEVKFSYLKHVVLKFLTTESKHLIRPVSTLLYLSESEEKLLEQVLEYRKSWFGSKPSMSFL